MNSEPRYANGAMLPDSSRILAALYVRRCPDTFEVSWPPTDMELQLIELGLINRGERKS
jgi:hypothetical protein